MIRPLAVALLTLLLFAASPALARPRFWASASTDAYYCGAGAAHLSINFDGGVIAYDPEDLGRGYVLNGTKRKCNCLLFCGASPACNDAGSVGGPRERVNCGWGDTFACAQGTPEFFGISEVGYIEGPVAVNDSECVSFTCTDPIY